MKTLLGDRCKDCGLELTIDNGVFKGIYLQKRCKICFNLWGDETHISRTKIARKAQYVQWKFKISLDKYNKQKELQLGGCAICKQLCKTGRELAIDHDHNTNIIRDLLCQRCNATLGLVNDDEEILFAMIEYLKRHELKNAV